jgi:hypothetical protein
MNDNEFDNSGQAFQADIDAITSDEEEEEPESER